MKRNRELTSLAEAVRSDDRLMQALEDNPDSLPVPISERVRDLAVTTGLSPTKVVRLVAEMSRRPLMPSGRQNEELPRNDLSHFTGRTRRQAKEILEIGRASYRLRDADNISLAKIDRELGRSEREGQRRLEQRPERALQALFKNEQAVRKPPEADEVSGGIPKGEGRGLRVRQLQAQPASPGLVTAAARVIRSEQDLADFCAGEILVTDAIDPAMTFVIPLVSGIVERRGGMLIHGAIIARKYGIPCVTGIAEAAAIIRNGDRITLDGYLGMVFFPPPSGRVSPAGRDGSARRDLDDAAER